LVEFSDGSRDGGFSGQAFSPASRLRKAASPASDTSIHFGSGAAQPGRTVAVFRDSEGPSF
jgi:hypothetical protein